MLRFLLLCCSYIVLALPTLGQDSLSMQPTDPFVQTIRGRLDSLVQDQLLRTTQLGFYVYDLTADRPLYQHGHQQRLRPASTQKLLTALLALEHLGSD